MANVLIIHPHIALRASLLDYVRLSGHEAFEAADIHQARVDGATARYDLVVLGVYDHESSESAAREIKSEWPAAAIAVFRSATDLADVFDAIRHCGQRLMTRTHGLGGGTALPFDKVVTFRDHGDHRTRVADETSEHAVAVDSVTCAVFEKADRIAAFDSTVLITGPSGTGKDVLARRIHRHSARRGCKFVAVNCGCLPETLVESELFGYKKGAFTGALSTTKGLIEEAERGVLFLDEIGDMPLSLQVRLLRFLDSGEIRAVGDTCVKHVDVRIIAATNQDLAVAIREKRFREDLYFRLSVISLEVPPLRDRRADIAPLVEYHARRAAARVGVPIPRISQAAMALLVAYDWPGNVRELQNVVEQALVHSTANTITPDALPGHLRRDGWSALGHEGSKAMLAEQRLMTALRRNNGNHADAAAELGISRTTLWRRLRQLKLAGSEADVPTGVAPVGTAASHACDEESLLATSK